MQRGEFVFRTKGCVAGRTANLWQSCPRTTIPSKLLQWNERTEMVHHRLFLAPSQLQSFPQCHHMTSQTSWSPAVAEYNSIMGGADRFDQRRERYTDGRRSLNWWHHLLYFLVDLAIVNSFIMWNCNTGGQRDQLSFRLALVRQLTVGRETKKEVKITFSHKKQAGR